MGGSPGSPGCCQLDSCRGEVMVPGGASTEGHASCFLFFIFFQRNKWNFSSKGAIGSGKDVAACSPVARDVVGVLWGRAPRASCPRCLWKPTRLGDGGQSRCHPSTAPSVWAKGIWSLRCSCSPGWAASVLSPSVGPGPGA